MGRHDEGCGGMIWDGQGWVALVAGPGPCERVHGWTGEEAMSKEWEMGLRIFYLPSCRIECNPFHRERGFDLGLGVRVRGLGTPCGRGPPVAKGIGPESGRRSGDLKGKLWFSASPETSFIWEGHPSMRDDGGSLQKAPQALHTKIGRDSLARIQASSSMRVRAIQCV